MHWLQSSLTLVLLACVAACPADDTTPDGASGTTDDGTTAGATETSLSGTSASTSTSGSTGGETTPETEGSSTGVPPSTTTETETATTTVGADETTGLSENFLPPIGPEELPEAFVNDPYEVTFDLGGEQSPAGIAWEIEGAPDSLMLDETLGVLTGTLGDIETITMTVTASVPGEAPCPTVPSSRTYELSPVAAQ